MQSLPRVALITGGTGALGTAVTEAYLEDHCQVAVSYLAEREVAGLRDRLGELGGAVLAVPADVTRAEDAARLVETVVGAFGRVDYLLNLVGGFAGGRAVTELDEAAWDRMLDLNLRSTFLTCRAVLPHLVRQNFGRIVNVSSRSALKGSAGMAAYAVAKAGVITLTQAIADEVKGHDINVNVILPSVIDTETNRRAMPGADFSKWVAPEQIARVIVFLTSEAARPISGASVPVYGRA